MEFKTNCNLAGDISGNLTTMFALAFPILIFGVGGALDLARMAQVRAKMDNAAYAAATAAVSPSMLKQSPEEVATKMFAAQVSGVSGLQAGRTTTNVRVTDPNNSSSVQSVTLCYTGSVQTPVVGVFAASTQQIGNCETATTPINKLAQIAALRPVPTTPSGSYVANGIHLGKFKGFTTSGPLIASTNDSCHHLLSYWMRGNMYNTQSFGWTVTTLFNTENSTNVQTIYGDEDAPGFIQAIDVNGIRYNLGHSSSGPFNQYDQMNIPIAQYQARDSGLWHHILESANTCGSHSLTAMYLDGVLAASNAPNIPLGTIQFSATSGGKGFSLGAQNPGAGGAVWDVSDYLMWVNKDLIACTAGAVSNGCSGGHPYIASADIANFEQTALPPGKGSGAPPPQNPSVAIRAYGMPAVEFTGKASDWTTKLNQGNASSALGGTPFAYVTSAPDYQPTDLLYGPTGQQAHTVGIKWVCHLDEGASPTLTITSCGSKMLPGDNMVAIFDWALKGGAGSPTECNQVAAFSAGTQRFQPSSGNANYTGLSGYNQALCAVVWAVQSGDTQTSFGMTTGATSGVRRSQAILIDYGPGTFDQLGATTSPVKDSANMLAPGIKTTAANELVIGVWDSYATTNGGNVGFLCPTGMTRRMDVNDWAFDNSGYDEVLVCDKIVSMAGTATGAETATQVVALPSQGFLIGIKPN